MKRIFILIMAVILVISLGSVSFANDGFTVKHSVIKHNEEFCHINVVTPYFEGFNGSEELNIKIRNIITDAIGDVRANSMVLKELEKESILEITYDYSKNGDILCVQLIIYSYLGGAHGNTVINSITINTTTGQIYFFKDLFKDKDKGISFSEEYILDTIEKDPELYFKDYEKTIINKHGNYDFYFNGNNLVVYFGLYEIAPYAGGIRYFEINANDLKALLKEDVYNSIEKAKKRGNISYNGVDINSKNKVLQFTNEVPMVPLRDIAEALGYKVDWNKEDGAIIAGGFIKNGVNSYWKTGKEPLDMIPPKVIDGVTYVPIGYFTDVLEENVSFGTKGDGKLLVRAFSKEGFEDNFDRLIKDFNFPMSSEAAANMYAQAVKTRNGAIQYGLLSQKLRETKYEEFRELSFVTGVSSPWVHSYEIIKLNSNSFKIEFTLKTSDPKDLIKEVISITVGEDGQYWRIISMVEYGEYWENISIE